MLPSGYIPGSIAGLLKSQATSEATTAGTSKLHQLFSESTKKKRKREDIPIPDEKREKTNEAAPTKKNKKNPKTKKPSVVGAVVPDEQAETSTATSTTEASSKKGVRKHDPTKTKRTVFVGNLPNNVDKKKIMKIFRKCGAIESVRLRSAAPANPKLPKKATVIKKEFHDSRSNINAYVVFKEEESCTKAAEMNGTDVRGLHIRVDPLGTQQHDHNRSVFLGNLPYDIEEETVRECFSVCGDVSNVRLIRDKLIGVGKGFGYILFEDRASVSLALKLDGHVLKGRSVRVQRSSQQAIVGNKVVGRRQAKETGKKPSGGPRTKGQPPETVKRKKKDKKKDSQKPEEAKKSKESFRQHKTKFKKKQKGRENRKKLRHVAEVLQGKNKPRDRSQKKGVRVAPKQPRKQPTKISGQ